MIYNNIKKYYGDRVVLDIKSIEFKDGKIYGLKGHNGSGKTTFCRILANINNINNINNKNIDNLRNNKIILNKNNINIKNSGNVLINGDIKNKNNYTNNYLKNESEIIHISNFNNKNNANQFTIGYMPQHSVVFDMSVIDNMMLNTDDKKKAMALLKKYNIDNLYNKNAKTLSGGEKQKLCLARLMIKRYDMLILDEPTSSMDKESTKIAEKMIKEYNKKYKSIIIVVSHEEGQLERLTKNIYTLEKGKLI